MAGMIRICLLITLSWLLSGCAGVADLVSGPDPATYQPVTALVRDQAAYDADLALCRKTALAGQSGFSGGAVAIAGTKAAVGNAPSAAISAPLFLGEVAAGAGTEALDQATGARTPKMRALLHCITNATNQDRSAILADPAF